MLKNVTFLTCFLGAASSANAACISVAELRGEDPNTNSYVHEVKRETDRSVSVYRRGQSFEEFVEVIREGACIVSIQPLNSDQFLARYLEYPEPWIAEQEGADNEGMAEGEVARGADLPLSGETALSLPLSTQTPDQKTAFRGLSLGMTRDEIMSVKIDGFKPVFSKGVTLDGGYSTKSSVSFKSTSEETCASAELSDANMRVEKLTLHECLFGSKDASLQMFTQKFADSYGIEKMIGSQKLLDAGTEASFEGETNAGEKVKISKGTARYKNIGRVSIPIRVEITEGLSIGAFD